MNSWPTCPICGSPITEHYGVKGCRDSTCGYIGKGVI